MDHESKSTKSIELNELKGSNGEIQTVFVRDEEDPNHVAHVAPKYLGTATDQRDMSVLGRQQVLRVRDYRLCTEMVQPIDKMLHSGTFASFQLSASDAHSLVPGKSF